MMTKTRVTKDEVLEASGGMLKKQFYVVFTTPTNGIAPVMEKLPAHLAHQCEIERQGIMVAAGPHWTDDEQFWDGDGMFVIRATSLAHATEIAASDPMHKSGARAFTVRPWLINEGGLVVKLSFSDGKMTID
ncbi:YciI family protein [Bradyrhizobium centrolobii]|nr:YciI family protein [Bradyrhizobium centrolobii]